MDSENEKRAILNLAYQAFGKCNPPAFIGDCRSVKSILSQEGDDFFPYLNEIQYHLDDEEAKFFIPYAMEFHLGHNQHHDRIWHLEWWLMHWSKFTFSADDSKYFKDKYQNLYSSMTEMQRESLCKFIVFVRGHILNDEFDKQLDEPIKYWCKNIK